MEEDLVVSVILLIVYAVPYLLLCRVLWHLGSYLKNKWMDSVKPKDFR